MHIMSTNFIKSLIWKHEYDSNCDLINSAHQIQMTNDHHMPLNETPPHENSLRTPLCLGCWQVYQWRAIRASKAWPS